jgi:hypothetical protein
MPVNPFVGVGVKTQSIDLGTVMPGSKSLTAKVDAHVVANCSHRIAASFKGFKRENSSEEISSKRVSVTINGKGVPVGTGRVEIVNSRKPTGPKGVDIPMDLNFDVKVLNSDQAGTYHGSLVLTVIPG